MKTLLMLSLLFSLSAHAAQKATKDADCCKTCGQIMGPRGCEYSRDSGKMPDDNNTSSNSSKKQQGKSSSGQVN